MIASSGGPKPDSRAYYCLEDVAAIDAADPRLDHRVVKATLKVEGICAILPLEAFMRPVRLNMRGIVGLEEPGSRLAEGSLGQDRAV